MPSSQATCLEKGVNININTLPPPCTAFQAGLAGSLGLTLGLLVEVLLLIIRDTKPAPAPGQPIAAARRHGHAAAPSPQSSSAPQAIHATPDLGGRAQDGGSGGHAAGLPAVGVDQSSPQGRSVGPADGEGCSSNAQSQSSLAKGVFLGLGARHRHSHPDRGMTEGQSQHVVTGKGAVHPDALQIPSGDALGEAGCKGLKSA